MTNIKQTNLWRRVLIGYWLLIPVVFLSYTGLTAIKLSVSFQQLLTDSGTFAVGLLLICLMLVMALMMMMIDSQHEVLLKKYLVFAMIQQVVTLNVIGAVAAFLYYRTLSQQEDSEQKLTPAMVGVMGFILILSLIMSLISFNVFKFK
ncbi:hypothetical protein ACWOAH_02915 [Vagococcus vulneris]|uniref:Uncharacterized protein n=1 Tax=Vagococcus vulneris TaxID=1977869 RepID=A0A429ZXN5_9ENTE|nr:hypothetical protein [Vagococcus vulneris]RST98610.1 hypothetical protein CBF37_07485 [Vagococcus vulneris]